jgi:hypothetical protein
MATKHAPVDAGERDLAAAQLDDIACAHAGKPWASWKSIVVEWHVQTLADSRAESWIPGMVGSQDPAIERALSRFYSYHMRAAITRLKAENTELQRKLIDAVACARFYASGHTDDGERAHSALAALLSADAESVDSTGVAKHGHRH